MKIAAIILTNGREPLFRRTIRSWRTMWGNTKLAQAIVIDDSQEHAYSQMLHEEYGGYDIFSSDESLGFGGAIQAAWKRLDHDIDYVFHLEDDFTFNSPIDVTGMLEVLGAHPRLAQLVLKRQPWSPEEHAAGGIVEMWPDLYTEMDWCGYRWTEHDLFFSTNPSFYPAAITEKGWPSGAGSEAQFTEYLRTICGHRFAFWGAKFDPPRVTHIGRKRTGRGY